MKPRKLKAPFPWFGGKSRVADLVWERFGDTVNYVEPFFGSGAVMLARPFPPRTETVNDLDCVGPLTKILKADLTWTAAINVRVGDKLIAFDESNGPARTGLRAPTRYRRLREATVTSFRLLEKPSYRLTFDDGTQVVASENHLWLGGSHKTGGRGWRWIPTKNMVCNRKTQRSWVLKVANVVHRKDQFESGWLGGFMDGEGMVKVGPGLRILLSQNEGPILDKAERLLRAHGFKTERAGLRRCRQLAINGGVVAALSALMAFQPDRLIKKFVDRIGGVSLYGREHRAVGLVKKEFLGLQPVVAIETDTKTFIAEGLASHNCFIANFWRAVQKDPKLVALWADWPVNEADLHARHLWLVKREEFREKIKADPEYYDAKIAGWWVWGISCWIGSGWCSRPEWKGRINGARAERGWAEAGVHAAGFEGTRPNLQSQGVHREPRLAGQQMWRKRPELKRGGRGAVKHLPDLGGDYGATGRGVHASARQGLEDWMFALADRLRRTRVCCGDWKRILGRSPTECIGVTGIFLDPPYSAARDSVYSTDSREVAHDVREWAIAHGDNPMLRIAYCSYGEEPLPKGWVRMRWKANGGHGNASADGRGRRNSKLETIDFSPHCLHPNQLSLFKEA